MMPEKFREIIRIAGANVDGTRKLPYALTEIKGVGISLAKAIVNKAGLNPNARLGFLSDKEVKEIEDTLRNIIYRVGSSNVKRTGKLGRAFILLVQT